MIIDSYGLGQEQKYMPLLWKSLIFSKACILVCLEHSQLCAVNYDCRSLKNAVRRSQIDLPRWPQSSN